MLIIYSNCIKVRFYDAKHTQTNRDHSRLCSHAFAHDIQLLVPIQPSSRLHKRLFRRLRRRLQCQLFPHLQDNSPLRFGQKFQIDFPVFISTFSF